MITIIQVLCYVNLPCGDPLKVAGLGQLLPSRCNCNVVPINPRFCSIYIFKFCYKVPKYEFGHETYHHGRYRRKHICNFDVSAPRTQWNTGRSRIRAKIQWGKLKLALLTRARPGNGSLYQTKWPILFWVRFSGIYFPRRALKRTPNMVWGGLGLGFRGLRFIHIYIYIYT